ncbi:ATP-dependent Clp protease adaptor ClpS [Ornithobacterium rhinotracheale]|uniref:ATP-dependent Clp protease adaptor ClpS n=1 Tax=Ornithobacterium rhinotracheale TaxID=28251 RepID=A0A410JRC9_ORNRH|nr:ATP-dependent Clp protease adaptor ClpS [Ornithobacterium rhinotracheale]QAR30568.1 ATP-dependent Clp protease adaptor ClpS [Ornithobacterium rhinotracheale]
MKLSPYNTQTETLEDIAILTQTENSHRIILHNDEVNTFDWVIECLIKICKHTPLQAEQCTLVVHYSGKCEVKSGDKETLIPMCSALLDCGLSAEIV